MPIFSAIRLGFHILHQFLAFTLYPPIGRCSHQVQNKDFWGDQKMAMLKIHHNTIVYNSLVASSSKIPWVVTKMNIWVCLGIWISKSTVQQYIQFLYFHQIFDPKAFRLRHQGHLGLFYMFFQVRIKMVKNFVYCCLV